MNQLTDAERIEARQRITDRMVVTDLGYSTPCWISNRALMPNGYTRMGYRGQGWLTHRLAYVAFGGPIPDGLVIDHLCRQRACTNPDHLEPVTTRTNLVRGVGFVARQVVRTHCKHGHPLSGDNLYVSPSLPGTRCCRICRADAVRRHDAAARARRDAA